MRTGDGGYVCTYVYLGNVPHVEEIVYLCWSGQHASRDEVINLNGGSCHQVSKWLHVLVKILELLIYHCAKDTLDLTLL